MAGWMDTWTGRTDGYIEWSFALYLYIAFMHRTSLNTVFGHWTGLSFGCCTWSYRSFDLSVLPSFNFGFFHALTYMLFFFLLYFLFVERPFSFSTLTFRFHLRIAFLYLFR